MYIFFVSSLMGRQFLNPEKKLPGHEVGFIKSLLFTENCLLYDVTNNYYHMVLQPVVCLWILHSKVVKPIVFFFVLYKTIQYMFFH